MKKPLFFSVFVCAIIAICFSLMHFTQAEASGSPGGYTGAPGDNNCTECHSGSVNNGINVSSFTSSIPSTGYVPGQTYSCTLAVNSSRNKHGFELMAVNTIGGTNVGTFVANTQVKTLSGGKRVTHKSSSTSGTGGRTWVFDWTAPSTGQDTICFYYAVNATNSNFSSSGDSTFISSVCISQNVSTDVYNVSTSSNAWSAYPNPLYLGEIIKIYSPFTTTTFVEVYDIKGSLVYSKKAYLNKGENDLPFKFVQKGIYVLRISSEKGSYQKEIMVY